MYLTAVLTSLTASHWFKINNYIGLHADTTVQTQLGKLNLNVHACSSLIYSTCLDLRHLSLYWEEE